jgi:hypothetical protein
MQVKLIDRKSQNVIDELIEVATDKSWEYQGLLDGKFHFTKK